MNVLRKIYAAAGILGLAVFLSACGGGAKNGSQAAKTPTTPGGPTATSTLPPQTATAVSKLIATAVAELRNVPVISQALAPGWQEEGEAGAKLTEVCQPAVQRQPFGEDASRLLRRTTGEQARSSAVFYAEQSNTQPYAQQIFLEAATCAQRLVNAWFGQTVNFGSPASGAGLGAESVSVQSLSGAPSATVVFFRHEEAVAAVAVVGPDSAQLVSQLATVQDSAITQKLQSLRQVTPAAQ